jgi:hypothetical protein
MWHGMASKLFHLATSSSASFGVWYLFSTSTKIVIAFEIIAHSHVRTQVTQSHLISSIQNRDKVSECQHVPFSRCSRASVARGRITDVETSEGDMNTHKILLRPEEPGSPGPSNNGTSCRGLWSSAFEKWAKASAVRRAVHDLLAAYATSLHISKNELRHTKCKQVRNISNYFLCPQDGNELEIKRFPIHSGVKCWWGSAPPALVP